LKTKERIAANNTNKNESIIIKCGVRAAIQW
jgi:hypothetical protein